MFPDRLSFNTSAASLNTLADDHNVSGSKGTFGSRIVTNKTNTVPAAMQQLGATLRGIPNPCTFWLAHLASCSLLQRFY